MYYEEKIIGGVQCYRTSPDGEWKEVPGELQVEAQTSVNLNVTETVRRYNYADGSAAQFTNVIRVNLHEDKATHVISTSDGYVHYIPPGWQTVSIKLPEGIPVISPHVETPEPSSVDSIELSLNPEDAVLQ